MSARATVATAIRVLQQLKHDPRTVALLLVVPVVLVVLMKLVFLDAERVFQRVGVPLVGIFPMTSMFLVTSVTMVRERSTGTLERLMTLPLAKADILFGYALAFGGLALVQALLTAIVSFAFLGLEADGPYAGVVAIAVLNALLGMALGLFVSAFAATEFQAVQFMPAFLLPQLLLCGLMVPRENMQRALELFSDILPMTYAYDALAGVATGADTRDILFDTAVLVGFTVGALALGSATLRRRTG